MHLFRLQPTSFLDASAEKKNIKSSDSDSCVTDYARSLYIKNFRNSKNICLHVIHFFHCICKSATVNLTSGIPSRSCQVTVQFFLLSHRITACPDFGFQHFLLLRSKHLNFLKLSRIQQAQKAGCIERSDHLALPA